MTTYTVSSATSTMMSLSEMILGCLPSQRHRRSSRSVCLPSVGEAHMGVIFFMATFEPVCVFLHATTMPYAPLPSGLSSWYLAGTRKTVSGGPEGKGGKNAPK